MNIEFVMAAIGIFLLFLFFSKKKQPKKTPPSQRPTARKPGGKKTWDDPFDEDYQETKKTYHDLQFPFAKYYRPKYILTKTEQAFFRVLRQAMKDEYIAIYPKVRIADFVHVKGKEENKKEWWEAFRRVSSKHVDFLLCNPNTSYIKLAIELDDSTHNEENRIARDVWVDKLFATIGIKIMHIEAQNEYDVPSVKQTVYEALREKDSPTQTAQ